MNKLTYIATNIVRGKIEISLSNTRKYLLNEIASKKFTQQDLKILLIEDFSLNSCLSRAVKLIEKF